MSRVNFKPGDKVSAYWKGYYEVIDIKRRYMNSNNSMDIGFIDKSGFVEISPLVYLKQIYDSNGKPIKSPIVKTCDQAFLKDADSHIKDRIINLEKKIEQLKNIKL